MLAISLCIPLAHSAPTWSLDDLMHLLAQQKEGKASFVEKKYLAALQRPLESSGELAFRSPDFLEKRTLLPKVETMQLAGDQISIEQGTQRRILRLADRPEISAFVDSIRSTLKGDLAQLQKNYAIELGGTISQWQLKLTPLSQQMRDILQHITFYGAQATLTRIDFVQADGDRSVMFITPLPAQGTQ